MNGIDESEMMKMGWCCNGMRDLYYTLQAGRGGNIGVFGDLHEVFASVDSREEFSQGRRARFDAALVDVEVALELSCIDPSDHLLGRLAVPLCVLKHDEPLHLGLHGDQRLVVLEACNAGAVVVRNGAAQDDAGLWLHREKGKVEDLAANVVKHDVKVAVLLADDLLKLIIEVWALVVECFICTEVVLEPRALVCASCDGNDLCALELGNLDSLRKWLFVSKTE